MKLKFTNQLWLILGCLLAGTVGFAQQQNQLDIATEHVRTHFEEWGLTAQDIDGMTVNDMYTDPSTGITRVYFLQRYRGIPVHNAIQNLSIAPDGRVFHVGKRFISNIADKVNTVVPVLSADQAVHKLLEELGISAEPLRIARKISDTEFIFEKGNLSQEDIKVKLSYQYYRDLLLLAWDVSLEPVKSSDMWSVRIDAVTGSILDKANWTVYCKVNGSAFSRIDDDCAAQSEQIHQDLSYAFSAGSATYNVWPSPSESPKHGPRTLVTDPHDLNASPYGWHDTNGEEGPEYTITRGNNAHAYEDSGNQNGSANNEPDGGDDLIFDFDFDESWEPLQYREAATVNLFFWNNVMHDFSYSYGFTEAAGNFQQNNYGNGGAGNDYVRAEAQDGSGTNNANFSTPGDGSSPRMQMYLWNSSSESYLVVNEPSSVAGNVPTRLGDSAWGAGSIPGDIPVTAEVIIVDDGVPNQYTSDGCEDILNGDEINGKIALIDRGGCDFAFKALNAQNNGAIGVIICDIIGGSATSGMGGGTYGPQVHIPSVLIPFENCQTIRQFAGSGLIATLQAPQIGGPLQLDGDLDNGIIAHEYGHGISNRMTGGPSASNCLGNAEQMGEGWSDFFSLVTTVRPGDTETTKRGVGTYAFGQDTDGGGIRNYPYTTDMSVNPWTYAGVAANQEVHDVGEIWATMLWDLYWKLTNEYGWDEDLYYGTGGNNLAIRLVFEGMKNQPCQPGFVDGRDAILKADSILYGGANQCLIWKVFGRRGVGLSASQGSSNNAGDQVEAFDIPCECRNSLSISKSVTDFINAGEEIEVRIDVSNCKVDPVSNIKVFDEIPGGTTFKAGSSNIPATAQGNSLTFNLGDMPYGSEQTITYTLTTASDNFSIRYFLDDIPSDLDDSNWEFDKSGDVNANNIWSIQDAIAHSPEFAWNSESTDLEAIQTLELIVPWKAIGNRPTLRFFHRYETEAGADGGVVEVKDKNEISWSQVGAKMLRNGYSGALQYTTFAFPLDGFSGNSGNDFKATYIDLSEWSGKEVVVRFRYGTDDNTGAGLLGWIIDDVEYLDLVSYNGQACAVSDQGDNICAFAPEEGAIVESQIVSGTVERLQDLSVILFPNPAKNMLNFAFTSEKQQDITISLFTTDGREVMSRAKNIYGNQQVALNVSSLPGGLYFAKISTGKETIAKKVIIE